MASLRASYRSVFVVMTFATGAALALDACGTEAVATDGCRKIEQARCRRAAACPELGLKGTTGVEECVQYARDRCLHGLAVADPGGPAIDACAAAIQNAATCDVVVSPEIDPACAFLKPTPTVPDAAIDGTTVDVTDLDTASADGG
jgi:hypothetical protein